MKRSKTKPRRGSSTADVASVWKMLIIFNILLSIFGFWMIYSQNNYIMDSIQDNLPVAVPADYKGTSVVVNPFTGQFISVNSITLAGTLMGVLVLVGMYFVLSEKL
jgi:hypothetical protein